MTTLKRLHCLLRNISVFATPEERVRQALLLKMLSLGYPRELLVIEKELDSIPHLANFPYSLPKRRIDLLVFGKNIHPNFSLYPLLTIECKARLITPHSLRQLLGYNSYLRAYFLAAVSPSQIYFSYHASHEMEKAKAFPKYQELLRLISQSSHLNLG